jgi:cellulose synthase/poly-beta-1,6-N-acetylglucosamine synthase-like glycosyltransferase
MSALSIALAVLAVPALLASAYLFLLAAASRRKAVPGVTNCSIRFDIVVPAHDEESGIARTIQSLFDTDYPAGLKRVIVVADNCTDGTAARARAAGATVLTRDDPLRVGKGYALAVAFEHSLRSRRADAVVVVDADSVVSPNLLRAFAARLENGARAVQAAPAVLNAGDSWRTQLMSLALALFNGVRSLGRQNLGLSCGLRGNGMCLAASVLRAEPYRAFSLVEDLEYGIALGRLGVRVQYAPEAVVSSAMVSSSSAAATQRRRWELGRLRLARRVAPTLLREAIATRNIVLLDLCLDLLIAPLAYLALTIAAGCITSLILCLSDDSTVAFACWMWFVSAAFVTAYFLRGWQLSQLGMRGAKAVMRIPGYVAWKIALLFHAPPSAEQWVRTAREEALR